MAVEDLWRLRNGKPSRRDGRGLRYRVRHPGAPARSFRTKAGAESYYRMMLTERPQRADRSVTVADLVDTWLATKRGLSRKGFEACWTASRHVLAEWRHWLIADIRRHDVQGWLGRMEGSSSSRAKALQALAGICRIAIADSVIAVSPCDGVTVRVTTATSARFLSVAELQRLALAAGDQGVMILTLGLTGMRVGEVIALDVGDIDEKRGRARVRRSKTGEPRDVPIPASLVARFDLDRPRDAPLFTGTGGRRVNLHSWRRNVFGPAVARVDLDGLRIHDLRHTAASLAIAASADVKVVQRMLGHKSAAMTLDRYGHLFDHGLDDVSRRLDGMLVAEPAYTRSVPGTR